MSEVDVQDVEVLMTIIRNFIVCGGRLRTVYGIAQDTDLTDGTIRHILEKYPRIFEKSTLTPCGYELYSLWRNA